jgi:5'-deoxynucleotidase YfbR-like HD superfamily hydrolase
MTARIGDWSQTFTGRQFWPLDPRPEEIFIEDIAHALSLVCRFGGHCRRLYAVADHCVRVSRVVENLLGGTKRDALEGLLHDGAEAYVGDMIRPLKMQAQMAHFRVAERIIEHAIAIRFGLGKEMPRIVHLADEILLATEARDLMGGESAGKWALRATPLDEPIVPVTSEQAERMFLDRFIELGGVSC